MRILQNKTVFIVEDNSKNADIMLTTLQMAGARTSFNRTGQNIIHDLKSIGQIDIILMDLNLPHGLTGYDVFEKIKADPELAKIPVVVVSASDANVEMAKAQKAGFVSYISKPINFLALPKLIAGILDGELVWADQPVY